MEIGRLINIAWSGVAGQTGTTTGTFTSYNTWTSGASITFTAKSPGSGTMTLYSCDSTNLSYWSGTYYSTVGWDLYFDSTRTSGILGTPASTRTMPVRCVYSK